MGEKTGYSVPCCLACHLLAQPLLSLVRDLAWTSALSQSGPCSGPWGVHSWDAADFSKPANGLPPAKAWAQPLLRSRA